MNVPIFTGIIDKGKLILDQPQKYLVHLASLENRRVELILRKRRSQRSIEQNRYYWGVIVEILADHFGYNPEEMHEALKFHFLKSHEDKLVTVKSTAKLSTDEFARYINQIVIWAATEYQIFIPPAGEVEI